MKGVDVNGAKGAIDWRRVKADGIGFAFVKATEGRTFDDERFSFNRRAAKAAGLVVGAYHYARPDNNTPEAEAEHFLRVARPKRGELLPALDWETDPPTAAWALRFLRAVESEIGRPPILYTYPEFLRRTGHLSDFHCYPLWYSRFGPNDGQIHAASPPPGFRFAVHQFTSAGQVDGIEGRADLNVLKLRSIRELVFYGAPSSAEEIVEPDEAELPPNPEGDGFVGCAVEEADRRRLEVEQFEPLPVG